MHAGNRTPAAIVGSAMNFRLLVLGVVAALAVIGCASGGSPSPTSSTGGPITSPEAAAQRVLSSDPRFAGIQARDPNAIGQAAWLDVKQTGADYEVTVRIGWGDCPAGCINEHVWSFAVTSDGSIRLLAERGDPVPAGVTGGGGQQGISGRALAGPTCPVQRNPPDPNCADRPVVGAVLVIRNDAGAEVARATTDASGAFAVPLPPGSYTLVPQPAAGILGTAAPQKFTVRAGASTVLEVSYDTGIR